MHRTPSRPRLDATGVPVRPGARLSTKHRRHRFTVLVVDAPTREQAQALAALPDHPLVESRPGSGTGRVTFRRAAAADPIDVIVSAIGDLEATGLRAVRLVHDDWVTLADVGERVGRSREAVRLWSIGRLGPGGFPPPVNPGRDTSLYCWIEVSRWLRERLGMRLRPAEPALAAANLMLLLRQVVPRADAPEVLGRLLTGQAGPGVVAPTRPGS